MSAFARIRSCPRVYGTTQNAQWSLQPSMIVTYAFTGSARRVIPSGKLTSSQGLISTSANGDCAAFSTSSGQHLQPLRARRRRR